jgi:excisionase family DNA binding protein
MDGYSSCWKAIMTEGNEPRVPQYLTAQQVAKMFQVTSRTIVRWAEQGIIPGFKVGDFWRFDADEIEAHIKQQRATKPEKKEQ